MAAGNLYWAIVCIPVTAVGFTTPLVAGTMGGTRKRTDALARIWALTWQSVWASAAILPILGLVGLAAPAIFEAFKHEPDLAQAEAEYLRILLLVAPASMLEAGLTAFFVGRRITRPLLLANVTSAAANIALDYWFIFGGLGLAAGGVKGAASATAVAMWIKVAIYVGMLLRVRSFRRYASRTFRPSVALLGEIFLPGSTLGLQQLVRSTLFSLILLWIGAASVDGLAGSTAALSLYQLLSIPAIGLATAVTVIVSQAVAAESPQMIRLAISRSLTFAACVVAAISATLLIVPELLLSVALLHTSPSDRAVIWPIAKHLLMLTAVYNFFDVGALILAAIAKALGRTTVILLATLTTGLATVLVGKTAEHFADDLVMYWWQALLVWAVLQFSFLAIGVWKEVRTRAAEGSARESSEVSA